MNKTARTISDRFLAYLKEEGLDEQLSDIATQLSHEAERRQTITVMSALPLSDKEKDDLQKTLFEKWSEHPIVFTHDETLLSGMIIAFRDRVIDLSGRNALTDLSQKLS